MAVLGGEDGDKVVGRPYSMDGVYADEIQPFVRESSEFQPDHFDLEKMFSLFLDQWGRWKFNLNSTFYLVDIPDEVCQWFVCPTDMHWPSISWRIYGSTRLYWLLMKLNGVRDQNLFAQVRAGTKVRYLSYGQYVSDILSSMEQDQLRQT